MLLKPSFTEYPEYYGRYINDLPDSGILDHYEKQTDEVLELFNNLTEDQLKYKYAPNKWSVIEVLGHLIDSEIIMGYRSLIYARQDKSNLHMYDHDKYVETGFFKNIESNLVINHFAAVRNSNISLFKTFTNEMWMQKGLTGGKEFTTRTIPYIFVGHTNHHISVIKEKYL
ncbi:MAG: DinB family protein [Melioribacteraceae bacterium]|nr:DinB family protein [Melioribacteraceae bacterium]